MASTDELIDLVIDIQTHKVSANKAVELLRDRELALLERIDAATSDGMFLRDAIQKEKDQLNA